jgi:hypothetical protein
MANSYDVGDLVRVSAVFTDLADGDPLDPTVVKVSVKAPTPATVTYTYLVDSEVVKDATGYYHFDVDIDEEGDWYVRVWSTGVGQAAKERKLIAKAVVAV